MGESREALTVYFDAPFWAGVFERIEDGKLSVCRVTFGAEPKDYEALEFVLKSYCRLKFSPSVEVKVRQEATNPKRIQREARRQTAGYGIGTKSQQALQMQREENKPVKRMISKRQREAEKRRMFDLKQQKRKEKHSTEEDDPQKEQPWKRSCFRGYFPVLSIRTAQHVPSFSGIRRDVKTLH